MAPFRDICWDSRKSSVQLQEIYPDTDRLFSNKAAWKVFRKVRKFDLLEDDEATVLAVIRFVAVF